MKAIKITQEIKDKNKKYGISWLTKPTDTIIAVPFPNSFYVNQPVSGGYKTRTDLHEADGWKVPEVPQYDPKTHKLGDIEEVIFNAGEEDEYSIYRYTIIAKTQQEIEADAMAENSQNKRQLLQEIAEAKILEEAQDYTDKDASKAEALYPLWQEFEEDHRFEPPFKVQDFDENTNLVLYRAIQPNDKRENTRPKTFPAGWTKIEYINGYEVWRQPIGGDEKYPYLDPDTGEQYLVTHNGIIWENQFESSLNIWEPTESSPTLWKNVGAL